MAAKFNIFWLSLCLFDSRGTETINIYARYGIGIHVGEGGAEDFLKTNMYTNPHNVLKRYVKMRFEKPMSSKTCFMSENVRIFLFT